MSNSSGVIKTSKSPDLVTYKILSEGEELSGVYQVKGISVSKEVNRIPYAKIVLADGDAAEQDFKLSNEAFFEPGKNIEITAGYHSDEETIFKGIVIKHSLKVRDGALSLIIECKDTAVKMTVGRKSNYYYDSKDSDVISELIAKYNGLTAEVEDTNFEHPSLVQYNATDWDFMLARAQASGKLCFVEHEKLTIAKPDFGKEEIETISFGATMLDFDAEIDARNQVEKVSSYTWSAANQEIVEVEAKDPEVSLNGTLSSKDLQKVLGLENLELRHGGDIADELLQDWADATLLYQQLAKVRGRVKFQGIPAVKPNTVLKLEGVGNLFNGKVYVSAVQHLITNGVWTVDVEFGINPEWFTETFEIHTPNASGLLPAIKGLHIGIVSQLEEDPDTEERILVQIPIINNQEQGIWCRVSSLDAGENRGFFFRPELGDEVIVGFINEDPNQAVVLGMLHSSAKPAPLKATDDNHEKGYVSRSEMKMMFDDDKKSMAFSTPAGKQIVMDDDADTIVIEDNHSNIITMGSNGITLESAGNIELKASGDVMVEGTNIEAKANAEFKAEGSAGAELSTSAIAVLKGSLVQIN